MGRGAGTIATEAAEQSERLTVPEITARARPIHPAIERQAAPATRPMHGPCAFLVEPERGFTPVEVELLRRHPFLQAVHLGPRILRAETAALVGVALLRAGAGG